MNGLGQAVYIGYWSIVLETLSCLSSRYHWKFHWPHQLHRWGA